MPSTCGQFLIFRVMMRCHEWTHDERSDVPLPDFQKLCSDIAIKTCCTRRVMRCKDEVLEDWPFPARAMPSIHDEFWRVGERCTMDSWMYG